MKSTPDAELVKKIAAQLVPDLTKALKLFKNRLSLLNKISKQPFEDYQQSIRLVSTQECQLTSKYQSVESSLLSRFHMEFQRLFCRIIEVVQVQKKTVSLQNYFSFVESVIYETISDQKCDYILALASIYGKGRIVTKELIRKDTQTIRTTKQKDYLINAPKISEKVEESKQKKSLKSYICTLRLLTGLDLDLSFCQNSYLYSRTHQDQRFCDMLERNKIIANDISTYKRIYTQNILRKQRRQNNKARKLIPASTLGSNSQSYIHPSTVSPFNPEYPDTEGDEPGLYNKQGNTTMTESFKKHQMISFSKQNKRLANQQRKISQSFRQTQTQSMSRQITPNKVFFCFNKLALKPVQEGKPIQFNIKRKNKQYNQTKLKFKQAIFQILVKGKKIEDENLEISSLKMKQLKGNSNLFI